MIIDDRKQRWLDFYEGKRRTVVIIDQSDYGVRPVPSIKNSEAYLNWNIKRYQIMMDSLDWLDDERVPYVTAGMGTDIFAGAFGCPVHYPENNNPYARPCVFGAGDLAKLKQPRLEDSSLMKDIEFALKLRSAAPDALIQLPDIQSPLDIAALIWEKADFFTAMIDEPQAVKDLIEMVYELETGFLDLWFKTFGSEFISHYPAYYMPFGITLSEDEIGSINNAQFEEFAFPILCRLSAHYGGKIGIHCCADAKHQWGLLKKIPGFVLFNMHQLHDNNRITAEASDFFRDGPAIWPAGPGQNECHNFRARAVLLGSADSKEEALSELKRLRDYSSGFSLN